MANIGWDLSKPQTVSGYLPVRKTIVYFMNAIGLIGLLLLLPMAQQNLLEILVILERGYKWVR